MISFVIFLLGLIIGILVRDIKFSVLKTIEEYKENQENKGTTKFFEPKTDRERWNEAKSVDNLIDDINN